MHRCAHDAEMKSQSSGLQPHAVVTTAGQLRPTLSVAHAILHSSPLRMSTSCR
jgi:hypothetical protein